MLLANGFVRDYEIIWTRPLCNQIKSPGECKRKRHSRITATIGFSSVQFKDNCVNLIVYSLFIVCKFSKSAISSLNGDQQ